MVSGSRFESLRHLRVATESSGWSHEGLDLIDGADAAARALGHAVDGGGGAGEVEAARKRPTLQQSVDEAGTEDVAGAGRVDDGDAKGRSVVELLSVPGDDAVVAKCGRGEPAAVATMHLAERGLQIGFAGQAEGKVVVDDEEVNVLEEFVNAFVGVVEVGGDEHAGLAGPAGGERGGGGVVAVDVKGAGVDDPFALELRRLEGEALVAAAEDGALAGAIEEDERAGAGCGGDVGQVSFGAGAEKLLRVEAGCVVVAELADIAGAEAPGLAGDDGAGDLAAEHDGAQLRTRPWSRTAGKMTRG